MRKPFTKHPRNAPSRATRTFGPKVGLEMKQAEQSVKHAKSSSQVFKKLHAEAVARTKAKKKAE